MITGTYTIDSGESTDRQAYFENISRAIENIKQWEEWKQNTNLILSREWEYIPRDKDERCFTSLFKRKYLLV